MQWIAGRVGVMELRPILDRVVVRPVEGERLVGGLVLPADEEIGVGDVVAVGPGVEMEPGVRIPVGVSVGDRVWYPKCKSVDLGDGRFLVGGVDILVRSDG